MVMIQQGPTVRLAIEITDHRDDDTDQWVCMAVITAPDRDGDDHLWTHTITGNDGRILEFSDLRHNFHEALLVTAMREIPRWTAQP